MTKIGLLNLDVSPSGLNQMVHAIISEVEGYNLMGIEMDRFKNEFQVRDLREACNAYHYPILKPIQSRNTLAFQKVLSGFEAVVMIGTGNSYHFVKEITKQIRETRFLFVPVSIHNDIEGSDISLGYDTAINAIIENTLKVKDTIQSLKYDSPRLFGVHLPGEVPREMLEELSLAVEGFFLPYNWNRLHQIQLEQALRTDFSNGQTFSFLFFDERINPEQLPNTTLPTLDFDWKVIKIDEAICMGQNPTALDRILAMKFAGQVVNWIHSNWQTGSLNIFTRNVCFERMTMEV